MPSQTMQQMSEDYGYQLAFLKSDPELYRVFQRAVDNGWDATRFTAAVRNTKWYKTTSATSREAEQLRYTDPATFRERRTSALAEVQRLAREMGSSLSSGARENLAEWTITRGWTMQQVQDYLAKFVGASTAGQAGADKAALRQTAFANGVRVSDGWLEDRARKIAQGTMTLDHAQQQLRDNYAATLAPAFKDHLKAGNDLADLAAPYMQAMARTLELNASDVDLFDDTIRKALGPDESGDSTPLWKFEKDLRKDPRWLKTNGARAEVDKVTRNLAQTFGVGV